jgi:hypothetical protein
MVPWTFQGRRLKGVSVGDAVIPIQIRFFNRKKLSRSGREGKKRGMFFKGKQKKAGHMTGFAYRIAGII